MFLIECEGTKIGELYSADSEGAKHLIVAAIQAGMVIRFEQPTERVPQLSPPEHVNARTILARGAWTRRMSASTTETPKAEPRITADPPEGSEFKPGDRVYLNWDALAESLKLNFSGKRWSFGVVEQFRSGAGIRATVGVMFEGDKALSWWQPKHLTTKQQAEG